MIRPESPYRRPATRRRPASDAWVALCAAACLLLAAVGAGVAFGALADLRDGGGDGARVAALVGVALLLAGVGGGVLIAGGRRG